MGRPRKQKVDYFPHFVSTDSRTKFILEQNWGNDGYAFWFKLLELLGRSEGHYYDCTIPANQKYFVALMKVEQNTVDEILNTLADLGNIDKELWEERKVIWCQSFVDNLQYVYSKRTVSPPLKPFTDGAQKESPKPEEPTQKHNKTQKPAEGKRNNRGVCDEIASLYNEICTSFPRLRSLSEARKKAIKARLTSGYTLESFKELFRKAEASSFLKGKNNRNWQATFDWMIKDGNMAKVIDGNYSDKGGNDFGTGSDRGDTSKRSADPKEFKPSGGFKEW